VQTTAELIGGMGIFGPANRCSLGFSSRKASGGADVYVLTAGHCTNFGGDWSGGFGGGMIGGVADSSFPINDYGLIVRMNTTWVATSKIQGGSSVLGNTVAPVGATVCRSGATTGFRCGRVIALNQTVSYGSQETVFQLTRTNVCSETGDSGGPFVSSTRQAQGVTSGGSGNCSTGGTTYYQPVNEILTFFGLTLVTG